MRQEKGNDGNIYNQMYVLYLRNLYLKTKKTWKRRCPWLLYGEEAPTDDAPRQDSSLHHVLHLQTRRSTVPLTANWFGSAHPFSTPRWSVLVFVLVWAQHSSLFITGQSLPELLLITAQHLHSITATRCMNKCSVADMSEFFFFYW